MLEVPITCAKFEMIETLNTFTKKNKQNEQSRFNQRNG